jgi:site-specific DNA recombinase
VESRSMRSVYMTISLAFLDPALVEAAVAGRLPRGIGATRLMALPPSWPAQWKALGLTRPN